eukprot:TRINITY_DN2633_c1_g1_i1.p1 TRINITY_DN2633_c1_g1~~TRINITY_DN2633_c1_g1_i1.p1  ORF type:complete len:399 (+),score=75.78 TRINITY_DN2633_c1_g1_i1:49-1245(+)
MAQVLPTFYIQSDWEDALQTKKQEDCWVSFEQGKTKVHGKLVFTKKGEDISIEGTNGFRVTNFDNNKKIISLNFENGEHSFNSCIQAPLNTFYTPTQKNIFSLDISPEGELGVYSSVDGILNLFSVRENVVRREFEGHKGDVNVCKFFPSGKVVLSGGADWRLKIWDALEGGCGATLTGHQAGILGVDIIDRGRNVLSCSRDGTWKHWDVPTQTVIQSFDTESEEEKKAINDIFITKNYPLQNSSVAGDVREVSTQGVLVAIATENGKVRLFDLRSKLELFSIKGDGQPLNCVSILGNNVFAGGHEGGLFNWDFRRLDSLHASWKKNSTPILKFSVSETLSSLAVACNDGSSFLFNSTSNSFSYYFSGVDYEPVNKIFLKKNTVVTCSRDAKIRMYKL